MAVVITAGANSTPPPNTRVATERDLATNDEYPLSKIVFGPSQTYTIVTLTSGLPVQPQTSSSWPGTNASGSQADGHSVTLGAQADAAAAGDTSTASLLSLFKRLLQRVTTLIGQLPAALTGAGNLKIAVVESTATQAVSGTVTADTELPAAVALADNLANPTSPLVGGCTLLWDGTQWLRGRGDAANGQDVDVTRLPGTVAADIAATAASASVLDDWDETDRCKVNPIVGQAGVAGGAGTAGANTQRVAIATDANDVDVGFGPTAATATLSNVTASASSVQLLAANTSRKGMLLYNDSTSDLFLKYGTTASATSFTVKVPPNGYWEMPNPIHTGRIDGIWTAANGAARITELT